MSKAASGESHESQTRFSEITVNGRTLTGPNSAAQRRDSRILLPLAAIARALGDTLAFDLPFRRVRVQRQSGGVADLDVDRGRIDENGSNVLVVSNLGDLVFTPNTDEFVLPLEITAVFFDVSIRYDDVKGVVNIIRSGHLPGSAAGPIGRSRFELYQVDYEIGINRYASSLYQNLVLNGSGRVGDGRFRFSANSSSSFRDLSIRNAAISFERPNGQAYYAGDVGVGGDLQLLTSYIRGASAELPTGEFVLTAFAGRSYSSVFPVGLDQIDHHNVNLSTYDTTIFGSTVSKNTDGKSPSDPWLYSAGAIRFDGAGRQGTVGSGSISYSGSRLKVRGDIAFGRFAAQNRQGSVSAGTSMAFDVVGTFEASEKLAFHARVVRIGSRFIAPQAGMREPIDLRAAGVTWSPVRWLSTSINASVTRRPGDPSYDNRYVTASFAFTPGSELPKFYLSHTESSTNRLNSAAFTIVNASKDLSRARLYFNGTRIRNSGMTTLNALGGIAFSVNESNTLDVSQGVGSRGVLRGFIDWQTNGFMGRLSFGGGVGYSRNDSGTSVYERLSATLKLPRMTSLQVSYYQSSNNPTLMVSIKGLLFKKRESENFLASDPSKMNSYGSVSGRVYHDIDLNGRYDETIDKPHPNAKVRVDGNRFVLTDENGVYNFESITAGDHTTYLDLLSIRADLTLLSEAGNKVRLQPGGRSTVDFRLIRTGRISGQLWYDENENGEFDDGEFPLADVRIVTSSGRDTLTGPDGRFTISDLAPGEHIILIDEKTLPDKTRSSSRSIPVAVLPGKESGDILMAVIPAAAEVRRFPSRAN